MTNHEKVIIEINKYFSNSKDELKVKSGSTTHTVFSLSTGEVETTIEFTNDFIKNTKPDYVITKLTKINLLQNISVNPGKRIIVNNVDNEEDLIYRNK